MNVPTKIEGPRGCDMAWAAGLFEGEGSLSVLDKRGKRQFVQLSMTSTDRDVLARFIAIVSAGRMYGPYARTSGVKPQYLWRAHGWQLLHRLRREWGTYLGERRLARFDEVLSLQPAPYVRRNLATRKLSDDDVRDVRSRLARGESQRQIGASYDMPQATISRIKLRRIYKEVA